MSDKWFIKKISDIIEVNPKESLLKGKAAKKISMDILRPFCRDISKYEMSEYSGGVKFRNGDTIMARITPCLENGKTAKVNILDDDEVGFGSTEYIVFRAKKGSTDEDFVYYLVCSPLIRDTAIKSMVGSSGRQRVQTDVIKSLELSLPDFNTQKRIGALLKSLDDRISVNTAINENLEQQAQTLFKAWFVDFEPFGNVMPDDWKNVTIEDITSLVSRGIAPKYDEDSNQIVLNQKCIRNHAIDFTPARHHIPKAITEKWLMHGDLLLNSTGQGTLGRAAQVWFEAENMTVDSHITIVRPKKDLLKYYVGLWGITHETEIEALHTGSTGQTELPRDRVKSMSIMLPDDKTLRQFNDIIAPMTQKIVANQEEIVRLASIRDSLLPKLMNGEIDVTAVRI